MIPKTYFIIKSIIIYGSVILIWFSSKLEMTSFKMISSSLRIVVYLPWFISHR